MASRAPLNKALGISETTQLLFYLTLNRAGTRIGRATWFYFGLWALLLIANQLLVHTMHVVPLYVTEPMFMAFTFLSPLILLLNRLDRSGPTMEEAKEAARALAAAKEAARIAGRESTFAYRLGKWAGRRRRLRSSGRAK